MLGFHLSQPVEAIRAARLVVDVQREEARLLTGWQADGSIWIFGPHPFDKRPIEGCALEAVGRQRRLFAKRDDLACCLIDMLLSVRAAGKNGPRLVVVR
ncbi:hypothetical protein D3C80_1583610 [compost metagenome]